jgi:hypothetical protein
MRKLDLNVSMPRHFENYVVADMTPFTGNSYNISILQTVSEKIFPISDLSFLALRKLKVGNLSNRNLIQASMRLLEDSERNSPGFCGIPIVLSKQSV